MGTLVGSNGGDPGDTIRKGLDGLMSRIPPALVAGALVLENEWKQLLLTPGLGRMYGKHRASKPGDPPAPDMANLQRSITHDPTSETQIVVGTNVAYAPMLEFGTLPRGKDNVKAGRGRLGASLGGVAPRPHARPAFTRAAPQMTEVFGAELKRGDR